MQLYTGENKGKTTAAAGLALRALGNDMKVLFVQFMKSVFSGEVEMLKRCGDDRVEVLRKWDDSFIIGPPSDRQVALAESLWQETMAQIGRFAPDLLVLDEICVALHYGLLEEETVLKFLKNRPESLEVVMTGQGASQALIEASDLVTEMCKIKHYYDKGVLARKGIEY
ncbi:cob(I)yrinic acid a,c-diamide adenosyltransferase [Hydrogenimonas sp.]